MSFSFKNYFKNFTSSTGSSLANIGTFGIANTAESIFTGVKEHNEFNEKQRNIKNANAKIENDQRAQDKLDVISAEEEEKERLRKARQPGRRQALLNLEGGSSLLTGF
jgi:hypothetical protein